MCWRGWGRGLRGSAGRGAVDVDGVGGGSSGVGTFLCGGGGGDVDGSVGDPVDPAALVASPSASAAGSLAANPIADLIRFFVGNGTAENPNAGILLGNGYSYTAASCPTGACDGGNGGLIGNGGDGFNGGNGGGGLVRPRR